MQAETKTQPNSNQKARLTALTAQFKARTNQAYQTAAFWVARNKRFLLWAAVGVAVALVYVATFIYLWRRSPEFRAVTKTLGREMANLPANLWANIMRIRADARRRLIEESPSKLDDNASVLMVEELPAEEIPARPVLDGRETIAA